MFAVTPPPVSLLMSFANKREKEEPLLANTNSAGRCFPKKQSRSSCGGCLLSAPRRGASSRCACPGLAGDGGSGQGLGAGSWQEVATRGCPTRVTAWGMGIPFGFTRPEDTRAHAGRLLRPLPLRVTSVTSFKRVKSTLLRKPGKNSTSYSASLLPGCTQSLAG